MRVVAALGGAAMGVLDAAGRAEAAATGGGCAGTVTGVGAGAGLAQATTKSTVPENATPALSHIPPLY